MALIKPGPLSAETSGSIGGTTFARNRGGFYVRNRSTPINPNSSRQIVVREGFAKAVNHWTTTLTQDQRDAWSLYAANVPFTNRIGEQTFLTGQQMCVRTNTLREQSEQAFISDGPTIFTQGTPVAFTVGVTLATPTLDVETINSGWDGSLDEDTMMFYMGQPVNQSREFFNGPWRFIGAAIGDTTTPVVPPINFAPAFPTALGQRVFVHARHMHPDGRISQFTREVLDVA